MSVASNLISGDTNLRQDIFVHDRQTGVTARVSVDSAGLQSNGQSSTLPSISGDGRYVAFYSSADNLVLSDTNGVEDIFVHDDQTGITSLVSVNSGGGQGNVDSLNPSISADGRYVAFHSSSSLVLGDANGTDDIFVHDTQTGSTTRVSVDSAGLESNGRSVNSSISADGRYVAFTSLASNLVLGDTNGTDDVFRYDRQTGTTTRASVDSVGAQSGIHPSQYAAISADGRYVAFKSDAANLVTADTNGAGDNFVHDVQTGATTRVSVDSAGLQSDSDSFWISISADGRYVAFISAASNLVAGDTNGFSDIFVRDQGLLYPGAFCTAGTTTNGCVASMSGTGTPSASSGSGFTISASAVEGQKLGLLFYGLDNTGFTPSQWGASSSVLCIKAPTQRSGALSSGGTSGVCDGVLAIDWNAFINANSGALGNPFSAGQHVFAQAWFRDPPSTKTTALSNALEFVVGP